MCVTGVNVLGIGGFLCEMTLKRFDVVFGQPGRRVVFCERLYLRSAFHASACLAGFAIFRERAAAFVALRLAGHRFINFATLLGIELVINEQTDDFFENWYGG